MEIKCFNCGKSFDFKGGMAHFKRAKHHYCSRACQNVIHGLASKKNGKQDKRYRIWCNIKKRAKKNGMIFNLSVYDIPEIPDVCPILGIKIKANEFSSPLDSSPSLDRINFALGYIAGNIRIISNRANRLRQNGTIEEWKLLIKDAENIQNKNSK